MRLLAGTERADALGVMHPGSQTPPNMTLLEGHDRAAAIDPVTKLAQLRALLVADHEKATAAGLSAKECYELVEEILIEEADWCHDVLNDMAETEREELESTPPPTRSKVAGRR